MNKKVKLFSILLADKIAEFIGSWTFIIIQSTILTFWIIFNVDHLFNFDPYPFILLNLFLSFEAAYATPLILMSANRQADRDRQHLLKDVALDEETNKVIKDMSILLNKIQEDIKLDKLTLKKQIEAKSERAEILSLLKQILRENNKD